MAHPANSAQAIQQGVLQTLYALFLGGIITAFLVVGLTTFYPTPDPDEAALVALDQREQELFACPIPEIGCELTAAEQAEVRELQAERDAIWAEQDAAQREWSRTAGLILIGLATALLALSLIRWDRAIVISNGMLLAGLFVMVGAIGFTIASDQGVTRFLVLSLALAITVALGYLRFARGGPVAGSDGADADAAPDTGELAERVADLEQRLAAAQRALGG